MKLVMYINEIIRIKTEPILYNSQFIIKLQFYNDMTQRM